MSSAALYKRLQALLPDAPVQTGEVIEVYADGTALITLPGGGQQRVRNPLGHIVQDQVFLQGGAVIGDAPTLPYVLIEI